MVFYRKYRPQKISELDNTAVRDILLSVLPKKNSPHAYLFTGPKGLGKTSAARIVAKVLNCEKKKDSLEPCNKCTQCTSISNGTSMDILEIDAASNRGIDEIRDLREKVRLAPLSAVKKVYIIDEVHMLTTEAFNALLKTLEEPPGHVVFILCTTESHKVPATILSRCFHIQFTLATPQELKRSLKRITNEEDIRIEDDALDYIAKLSDGSFRDGTKLLEEVFLTVGKKKITKELVEEKLHISNSATVVEEMLVALQQKNTKQAIRLVGVLTKNGTDLKYFLESIISELHSMLLAKAGVGKESEIAKKYQLPEIKKLVELFGNAHKELKTAVIPQLLIELAIIDYCQTYTDLPVDSHRSQEKEKIVSSSHAQAPRISETNDILKQLIVHLKSTHPSLVGLLRGCSVKGYTPKTLVLSTKYKYHKDRLEDRKMTLAITQALLEITGKEVTVSIVLSS